MAGSEAPLGDPAAWGVTLHEAKLNGVRQRWADTASGEADRARPVVLFLHGFPELWFSWRHQLKAVHAAGYRGIAPDMRGYGGTEAPAHMAVYNVYALAGDMLALLQHLGVSSAALVGHDHGAQLGWRLALMHPDIFVCYTAMSVPYPPRGPMAPVEGMRKFFGDERKPESDPNFFYILHHQLATAADDYATDTRAALLAMYAPGGESEAGPPPVTSGKLFVDGRAEPIWKRLPQPTQLPPWISQAEFDYFVGEFARTGWNGGLNWYRVMDVDWQATPQLQGAKVKQPVAFIAGSADGVVMMSGGKKVADKGLRKNCEQLDFVKFIDGAGHWIQQERPQEVSAALLEFLGKHREKFAGGAAAAPRSRL
mmetsp:Transcript_134722/g.418709  ORF Transcript_134722/g.418709 Transcript_134722/m.418709 type:complete len:368 (-) Transcript_134722:60-1163(-)